MSTVILHESITVEPKDWLILQGIAKKYGVEITVTEAEQIILLRKRREGASNR